MQKEKAYSDFLQHINKDIPYLIYKISNVLSLDIRTMVTATYLYFKTLPKVLVTSVPACIGLAAKINDISLDYRHIINACMHFPVYIRECTCIETDIHEEVLSLELKMCIDYKFDFKEKSYDLKLVCDEMEQKIEDHLRKIEELKKFGNKIQNDNYKSENTSIYDKKEKNQVLQDEQNTKKHDIDDKNAVEQSTKDTEYKQYIYDHFEYKRRAVTSVKNNVHNNNKTLLLSYDKVTSDVKTMEENINTSKELPEDSVIHRKDENQIHKSKTENLEKHYTDKIKKECNYAYNLEKEFEKITQQNDDYDIAVDKKIIRLPSHIRKIENRKECVFILFKDICLMPVSLFYSWKKIYKACIYIEHVVNAEFADEKDKDVVFIAGQIIKLYEDEYFYAIK